MLYLGYLKMGPQQVKKQKKHLIRWSDWKKRLIEPQVTSQGVNKRLKGKKNKKTVNPKDLIDDPPYAGDELRVNPPHPTVPSNLAMPGPSSAGEKALNPEPMYLLSYEEMMIDKMFNGPSSMETQSDLAPVQVLKEGAAVTQDGRTNPSKFFLGRPNKKLEGFVWSFLSITGLRSQRQFAPKCSFLASRPLEHCSFRIS